MSNFLYELLAAVSANTFSDLFILVIFLFFIISVVLTLAKKGSNFTDVASGLMTSLGILGTFAGIMIGLMEFEPENIDNSIGLLLEGLKSAFLTSLVGIFCSIIFKFIAALVVRNNNKEASVGPDDIHLVMTQQLQEIKLLISAIKGEEKSSLSTNLNLLRSDLIKGNEIAEREMNKLNETSEESSAILLTLREEQKVFTDRLWIKMEEFSQVLSTSASEQVIDALNTVIAEFNNKLTEQFGDNFKRLDESVKRLVQWQDNYRDQLEDMAEKYQLGVEAISATEQSLKQISEKAETIPVAMTKLHEVMILNQAQIQTLEERLDAFKTLRDKAIEAMPQIQQQLDLTMSAIGNSVTIATQQYEKMLLDSNQMMTQFSESYDAANKAFVNTSKQQLKEMSDSVSQSVNQLTNKMKDTANHIGNIMETSTSNLSKHMNTAANNMSETAADVATKSNKISNVLQTSVTAINTEVSELVMKIKEQSSETNGILLNANQTLISNTEQTQQRMLDGIIQLQTRLESVLEDVYQTQINEVKRTFQSLEEQVGQTVSLTGKAIDKQVEILDRQMQEEVTRVIQEMGQDLASVTQQFTRDYVQLTKEMGKVVQSVKNTA